MVRYSEVPAIGEITKELGLSNSRKKLFTDATKSFLISRVKPCASSSRDLPEDVRQSISREFLNLHGSEYFDEEADANHLSKLTSHILAKQWNNQVDQQKKLAARQSPVTAGIAASSTPSSTSRKRKLSVDEEDAIVAKMPVLEQRSTSRSAGAASNTSSSALLNGDSLNISEDVNPSLKRFRSIKSMAQPLRTVAETKYYQPASRKSSSLILKVSEPRLPSPLRDSSPLSSQTTFSRASISPPPQYPPMIVATSDQDVVILDDATAPLTIDTAETATQTEESSLRPVAETSASPTITLDVRAVQYEVLVVDAASIVQELAGNLDHKLDSLHDHIELGDTDGKTLTDWLSEFTGVFEQFRRRLERKKAHSKN